MFTLVTLRMKKMTFLQTEKKKKNDQNNLHGSYSHCFHIYADVFFLSFFPLFIYYFIWIFLVWKINFSGYLEFDGIAVYSDCDTSADSNMHVYIM